MQNKKMSERQRLQIGSSSLLLIFTVLCLVIFGTLSLSSAKADYGLALKNANSVKAYYEADSKGEELKKDVNERIIDLHSRSADQGVFQSNLKEEFKEAFDEDKNYIQYTIEAGDEQFLLVELVPRNYTEIKPDEQNFKVMAWTIQNKVDYEIDESMSVWDGI